MRIEKQNKQRKREKARQRYQAQLMRKPKYIREVFRILPLLLVLMLLGDYVFTNLAADSYFSFCERERDEEIREMKNTIARIDKGEEEAFDFGQVTVEDGNLYANMSGALQTEKLDQTIAKLSFKMSYPYFNTSYNGLFESLYYGYRFWVTNQYEEPRLAYLALYNTNGDLITTNLESNVYQVVVTRDEQGKSKKSDIYRLDIAGMEKVYPGLYGQLAEKTNPERNGNRDIEFRFEELYVKGSYVLPKTIKLCDFGTMSRTGELEEYEAYVQEYGEDGRLLETMDLSGCDFSDYTRLDTEQENLDAFYPIMMGINHPLYTYHAHYQPDQATVKKLLTDYIQDGERLPSAKEWRTNYYYRGYQWEETPSDSLYCLVAYDYDFYRDWKPILLLVYALNFVLMMGIALIIAGVRYNRKRLSYEVDSYRRKTTNAMAHDLKSPLMAISGYAENMCMADHVNSPQKLQHYAERILSVVGDMDRMIANILDLSKLEDAAVSLQKQEIALEKLVAEQLVKYDRRIVEKGLKVTVEGSTVVKADENRMGHLVDNLLSNAVKYSTQNSEIKVQMADHCLIVQNEFSYEMTAAPEDLKKPFAKGDEARNNTEGNGLGLSIADQIAKAHGFDLDIQIHDRVFEAKLKMR